MSASSISGPVRPTVPVAAKCDECPTTGTWVGCNLCRSSRNRTANDSVYVSGE